MTKVNIDGKEVAELGTPEQAAWTQIKTASETELQQMKRGIIILESNIRLAKSMIEKEKLK